MHTEPEHGMTVMGTNKVFIFNLMDIFQGNLYEKNIKRAFLILHSLNGLIELISQMFSWTEI